MSAWTEGSQRDATLAALPVGLKVAGGRAESELAPETALLDVPRAGGRSLESVLPLYTLWLAV